MSCAPAWWPPQRKREIAALKRELTSTNFNLGNDDIAYRPVTGMPTGGHALMGSSMHARIAHDWDFTAHTLCGN
jgi:hypothetical protein